ncbi:TadE/TadG family type IV pilus assembly protein [Alisedimentitalea sp. MJ-SS2]|uniref:TadE/TadG family type IV pilus assembly protein n=1 Tax=Aliisedimentitalea sp. MJ-SS2 TaxID=3049795 RepID=UPI0029087DAA|nr:TadE/TadG family type IV pilus assembly protein [Alisedimentitalea sp. MJ-SS2]MDU8929989.1 TadE/TadG family type IV pilus assembly protein [Alisedimentitalea sp. MJ-SS2]
MRHMMRPWLRLWRSDAGSATVEFAIIFPFYVTLFMTTVELGMITFRHSMLERGLDMAVREVRLGTGTNPTHDDIKNMICEFAGVLPNCSTNMRLEMILVDPRSYVAPPADADCIDHSEDPSPLRTFNHGTSNQMMLLRACFVFSPIFPTSGLGYALAKDGAGNAAMVASSAFVQEPK